MNTRHARASALAFAFLLVALATGGGAGAAVGAANGATPGAANAPAAGGPQAPAPRERLAPGSELEVTIAQIELYAMPPGLTRNVRTRVQNRIGSAMRGARLHLVSETESLYQVRFECQEGRLRVEAWCYKDGLAPAKPGLPAPGQ